VIKERTEHERTPGSALINYGLKDKKATALHSIVKELSGSSLHDSMTSTTAQENKQQMRAGRLDEAGVLAVRIGNDITRQNKVVSSTQAAKQTLKVSGPPLDNLRVGSVMMNLWTASPLNHSILTMYSLPLLHTTLRPLQSSQSLILSTNYIYMYVCMRKLAN